MKITLHSNHSGEGNFFHPSFCRYGEKMLMTMQTILGSDHYGAPQFSLGSGPDSVFSDPEFIPAFMPRELECGLTEGVADVRPFDLGDGRVAAFGCTTTYSSHGNTAWDRTLDPKEIPPDAALVSILGPDGKWGPRQVLDVDGETAGYRTACNQIAPAADGTWIVPFYFTNGNTCQFGSSRQPCFSAVTARYAVRGDRWVFLEKGRVLSNPAGRGFCEPSVTVLPGGGYALTLRAEDGFMHAACSPDGLHWSDPVPWHWEDGTPLRTDCTQQHFFLLGGRVFLAYTRDDGTNRHIMRFRAPLYAAEAVPEKGILFRASEQIVFPRQVQDGVEVLYGNFHAAPAGEDRAWVSDSALRDDPVTRKRSTQVLLAEISL